MKRFLHYALAVLTALSVFSCGKDDPVAERNIRPATQAYRFYEGNPDILRREVDSLLALHAHDTSYDHVAAIIVPHAGYEYSGHVAAAAYMALPKKRPSRPARHRTASQLMP